MSNRYTDYDNLQYNDRDEFEYYDIKNNPDDWYVNNLILILSKYNFDVYKNQVNETDLRELVRINMCVYEGIINDFNNALVSFIDGYLFYKYCHNIKAAVNINKYREILYLLTNIKKDANEVLKDFVFNNLLNRDKVVKYYYERRERILNPYRTANIVTDADEDIRELTSTSIFTKNGYIEFLEKYSNNLDKIHEVIYNYIDDGYFNKF